MTNTQTNHLIRSRRGSALLLVVVLVLLLAIMGTAFLVSARLSRDQITGTGSTLLITPANQWWPQLPANQLENALANNVEPQVTQALQNAIAANGAAPYRQPNAATLDIVGTSADANLEFLASRAPYQFAAAVPNTTSADIRWPFLSHIPGTTMVDLRDAAAIVRTDAPITSVQITYPATYAPITALANRTRVFPGLMDLTGAPVQRLAADADGDGIPDAGLYPVGIAATPVICQDGASHNIDYFAAVRIVDNAGAVNFNTAWSNQSDYGFTVTVGNQEPDVIPPGDPRHGLLGAFRSHIGLRELMFRNFDTSNAGAILAADQMAAKDMHALNQLRMNSPAGQEPLASAVMIGDDTNNTPQPMPYRYTSQGDALENGLARRIQNLGKNLYVVSGNADVRPYQNYANPVAPQTLTHRFGLANNTTNVNDFTNRFATIKNGVNSVADARKKFRYYGANEYDFWYYTLMEQTDFGRSAFFGIANTSANYPGTPAFAADPAMIRSYRPFVVMSNPISNRVPFHFEAFTNIRTLGIVGSFPTQMASPYAPSAGNEEAPPRTSANTATFSDLWRAYWEVMINDATANTTTPAPAADVNIFRTPLRYAPADANLTTGYTALVRSAATAANLIALRDQPTNTPVQPILGMSAVIGGTATPVGATVYGLQRQLFITEVYANNDNDIEKQVNGSPERNPNGYVAIELYNPYPAGETINLDNLYFGTFTRSAAGTITQVAFRRLREAAPSLPATLDGQQRVVIDNFSTANGETGAAKWRPVAAGATIANAHYCQNLYQVSNAEFMIFRSANGSTPSGIADANAVPVDSFSFVGFDNSSTRIPWTTGAAEKTNESWHYVRRNGAGDDSWRCVYPGQFKPALVTRRNEGTVYREWKINDATDRTTEQEAGQWQVDAIAAWRATGDTSFNQQALVALGAADPNQTYAYSYQIPLNLTGWPGPNNPGQFPFGLFARDGDLLQVPFIGAYRLVNGGAIVELTPVTMDAAFADDTDDANNDNEQLGRFVSLTAATGTATVGDPYAWTSKLYSYFATIQNPSDDYMPNVAPAKYAGATAVANRPGPANGFNEDGVPIEGKININTAPWQVLATLPLVRAGEDPRGAGVLTPVQAAMETRRLAKAIVRFRDINDGSGVPHGPFRSIDELNLVPAYAYTDLNEDPAESTNPSLPFRASYGDPATVNPVAVNGDIITPSDGLVNTFKNRMLALTRISNLITTRSDSFTAYILVQAWMDIGTANPVCVAEKREVMVIDRTGMSRATNTIPAAGIDRYAVDP